MDTCITEVEELGDRVRVHHVFKVPDGIPQKEGVAEIMYSDIRKLEKEPKLPESGGHALNYTEYRAEDFHVTEMDCTLVYHVCENQETARQREQWFSGGPYLRV